jgi:hypothetical protein
MCTEARSVPGNWTVANAGSRSGMRDLCNCFGRDIGDDGLRN